MFRSLLNLFRKDKVYKKACDDLYTLEFSVLEHVADSRLIIVKPIYIDWKGDYAILYKVAKR